MFIELENKTLKLNSGEFVVILKGVDHKLCAPEEVSVLLLKSATTLNAGNIKSELAVADLDKI